MINVAALCKEAKKASYELAGYSSESKNAMLKAISVALDKTENREKMKNENTIDVENAIKNGKDAVFIDRLTLTDARISDMIEGVRQIEALPDPVGEVVEERDVPSNALHIERVRAPLGVIGIIYEARPNVTVDAAALCLKSGNAVVLRGGKDAINSNRVLYEIMRDAIASAGLNSAAVAFIDDPSREATRELLIQEGTVDVIIPRGGEGLKKFVLETAKMPVIASAGGNCHIYVEKTADQGKAIDVIINAKAQRPSVCNALEHLIVDRVIAVEFLPKICDALEKANVEILATDEVREIVSNLGNVTNEDFYTEYEAYKITIMLVDGVKEAVDFINEHSTNHSDGILTLDKEVADYFTVNVDSAAVYVNVSTRFTDGFQFGLGAEMGISTQKLHARGPVALKELTSIKYIVTGDWLIRK